jgi:hypothetical protein
VSIVWLVFLTVYTDIACEKNEEIQFSISTIIIAIPTNQQFKNELSSELRFFFIIQMDLKQKKTKSIFILF